MVNPLLDRFLRYVKIETTSDENSSTAPSTARQLDLSRLLADELRALKLDDVSLDEHGIVMATIPATKPGASIVAWLAHVDTSPEFTAKGVKPIVHDPYDGRDIVLPGDPSRVIRVEETPDLAALKGQTIITTDGTTLLGADDKCGVAVIMTTAERLMADRSVPRGPIRVCFTCDEEIGRGVDHLDLKNLGAHVAYTLDGEGQGVLEGETFSADQAIVTITGVNTHPGYANGKMVNAIRLAAQFIERMPWHRLAPERAYGREGFLHPYVIEGGVPQTTVKVLLRSFVTAELANQAELLRHVAATLEAEHPRAKIDVAIKQQYRNMAEHLTKEPRAMTLAEEAFRAAGMEPKLHSIRGGTDGSRLSALGLPTPNLSTGMHNFHSPLEWACLEEMEAAVRVLIELAKCWSRETP